MTNLIHRGVVGSWRKGGRRALSGAFYVTIGVAMFGLIAWGLSNDVNVGGVGVLLGMWVLALGDASENIACAVSWVVDDEEVAYIY